MHCPRGAWSCLATGGTRGVRPAAPDPAKVGGGETRTELLPGEKSDRSRGWEGGPGRSVGAGIRVPVLALGSPGGALSLLISELSPEPGAGIASSPHLPAAAFSPLTHRAVSSPEFTAGINPSKSQTVGR